MKKDYKLYNFILPPFLVIGFTPWFFGLSLVGNFIIDSAVYIAILFAVYKRFDSSLYLKKIFILWGLGFLADLIGLFCWFVSEILVIYPTHPIETAIAGIIIASGSIFLLDYFIVFKRLDMTKKQAIISALSFAILTAPYTFLLRFTPYFR